MRLKGRAGSMNVIFASLAPGFSRVSVTARLFQPFQRLSIRTWKAVETVFAFPAILHRAEGRC
jgi:hypothetical protein